LGREDLWGCFVFSLATFTTLGSGITVTSVVGEVLVAIEVVLGYLMMSLLVAIFVRNTIGN
jgi:predicted permease